MTTPPDVQTIVVTVPSPVSIVEIAVPSPVTSMTVTVPGPQGPQGPRGEPGATGPAGPAGGGGYEFTQLAPSLLWTIVHNLQRYPSVTMTDSAGSQLFGDVTYVDANTITIGVTAPTSGKAYLN